MYRNPVIRDGDMSSGHTIGNCWWAPKALSARNAKNVFANGLLMGVETDDFLPHKGISCKVWHKGSMRKLAEGAINVFANGLAVGRSGDIIHCGDYAEEASEDVFAGP